MQYGFSGGLMRVFFLRGYDGIDVYFVINHHADLTRPNISIQYDQIFMPILIGFNSFGVFLFFRKLCSQLRIEKPGVFSKEPRLYAYIGTQELVRPHFFLAHN